MTFGRVTANWILGYPALLFLSVIEAASTGLIKGLEVISLCAFCSLFIAILEYKATQHLVHVGNLDKINSIRLYGTDDVRSAHQRSR